MTCLCPRDNGGRRFHDDVEADVVVISLVAGAQCPDDHRLSRQEVPGDLEQSADVPWTAPQHLDLRRPPHQEAPTSAGPASSCRNSVPCASLLSTRQPLQIARWCNN